MISSKSSVADDDQVARFVGARAQARADQRRHHRERVDLPASRGLVGVGHHRRDPAPRRIHAGGRFAERFFARLYRRVTPDGGQPPVDGWGGSCGVGNALSISSIR
jgi:hypothetical protein